MSRHAEPGTMGPNLWQKSGLQNLGFFNINISRDIDDSRKYMVARGVIKTISKCDG